MYLCSLERTAARRERPAQAQRTHSAGTARPHFKTAYIRNTMKLIIFDLDGTLLNTIADLGGAVNHTLECHQLPQHDLAEYKMMVGRGMRNLVKAALPTDKKEDEAFVDAFLKDFLDYYMAHIDRATVPYPGIPELISQLNESGCRLAVASNKLQAGTETLIRKFFPGIPFVAVCGNSPAYPLKPDAALVKYIMDQAQVGPQDTLMVGDSGIDILTAHNAGIPALAVSWGFRPIEDLAEADHIAGNAAELTEILRKLRIFAS